MIVFGNASFAKGMKLAGIDKSFVISQAAQIIKHLEGVDKNEFIIMNVSIAAMVPELLEEFANVVTLPDDTLEFGSTDDLKDIIRSAVGIEIDM
ncbi:hypothetical protein H6504_02980 [Candidatus Woesearchaeota archaeon]|nr:hypothetical protein [Candidatus Woesearchaeota archaeon]